MKILHLEDNPRDAQLARDLLMPEWPDCFISVVATRDDFVSLLKLGGYDLILSDYQLPGFNGLDALLLVQDLAPDIPFVFFSGTLGEESAIEAVRSGAADYVIKDRMQRLPMSIRRVLREADARRDRQDVETALAQEQQLLRLMMENLPDHVYFKDLQSAFMSVSRSKALSHGLEPEQMKGKSDFELFGDDHAKRAFHDEQKIIQTGQPLLDVEERITWADGTVRWMSASKLPLRDHTGAIIGTFGISRDITARKRDEERIREQAEIINQAPIAIFITDLNNSVTYCNEGAARLYGVARDEILGHLPEELLDEESAARLESARRLNQRDGAWSGVVPLTTRAGRSLQLELHLSRIADSAGRPRARLAIAIDVTEKKKLEEQFLRAQRLESLGMLAAGIAHDLNNVLAPILMGAPLLHGSTLPSGDLKVLEAIETSAVRGAALVRQILSFAHGASGGEEVLVQAKHLIRDVSVLVHQSFPKSVRIEDDVPGNLWTVQGNPTQLHQVVLNLCVNARDAMPNGGVLRLLARNRRLDATEAQAWPGAHPGAYLMIEVSDTGTGIPPHILERIWDPFFTTKGEGKGTGLGLATVRGIVANHYGFVTLDTVMGQGTTFRVFLPVAEGESTHGDRPASASPFAVRGRGELVLVVDDEETIRHMASAVLSRSGYRVLTAVNGREALTLYVQRRQEVALIVTDLGMPEMGGAKLALAAKALNPSVRVLFMTGGDMSGSIEPAPAGAPVMAKPFRAEDLLNQVQESLGHPA